MGTFLKGRVDCTNAGVQTTMDHWFQSGDDHRLHDVHFGGLPWGTKGMMDNKISRLPLPSPSHTETKIN